MVVTCGDCASRRVEFRIQEKAHTWSAHLWRYGAFAYPCDYYVPVTRERTAPATEPQVLPSTHADCQLRERGHTLLERDPRGSAASYPQSPPSCDTLHCAAPAQQLMICGYCAVPFMFPSHLIWISEDTRVRAAGGPTDVYLPCLDSMSRSYERDAAHWPHGGSLACRVSQRCVGRGLRCCAHVPSPQRSGGWRARGLVAGPLVENRSLSRVPAGLRRDQGASQDALAGILRGAYLKIVSKPLEIRAGISTVNRPAPGISGYPSLNIRLGCLRDTRLSGGVSRVEMVSFT